MTPTSESQNAKLFPTLEPEHMACMVEQGERVRYETGEALLEEGDPLDHFFAVVSGRVRITKSFGASRSELATHGPGGFVGEISSLQGGTSLVRAIAIEPTEVVRVTTEQLRQVLTACPSMSETIISAFANRREQIGKLELQNAKLASLGKLSAGLAHEINNPAAAAGRTIDTLMEGIDRLKRNSKLPWSDGSELAQCDMRREKLANAGLSEDEPDPLERAEIEDSVAEALEEAGVEGAWEIAPDLVTYGVRPETLSNLRANIPESFLREGAELLVAHALIDSSLQELRTSIGRVSELVGAIKRYSYMDRGPVQEIDLKQSLEDTLTVFGSRLKNVQIEQSYPDDLPTVCAQGSEINQVWTNLVSNALDAMGDRGSLAVSVEFDESDVTVRISDDGPGIPEEAQPQIFDAFFTTKGVGSGTGLGLDTVRRIVVDGHGGDIRFETSSSGTTFVVTLPILGPQTA